ncbi:MAG: hypothetical protein BWY57_02557 [Betaproteobacteria bacterium ADurb.Bin341]|nr:MAG: hypothetical protein BWY57_02557 [Betaproteobacteria bacterium ADurb.Bin341]
MLGSVLVHILAGGFRVVGQRAQFFVERILVEYDIYVINIFRIVPQGLRRRPFLRVGYVGDPLPEILCILLPGVCQANHFVGYALERLDGIVVDAVEHTVDCLVRPGPSAVSHGAPWPDPLACLRLRLGT